MLELLSNGTINGSIYKVNGKEFYTFNKSQKPNEAYQ